MEAWFGFSHGVNLHFINRAKYAGVSGPWGMELIGSKGRLRLLNDANTKASLARSSALIEQGNTREWVPLDPIGGVYAGLSNRSNITANGKTHPTPAET